MISLVGSDDGLPPEAEGVARLAETLQAHMWPNITMNGRDPTTLETNSIPKLDVSRSTTEQEASGSEITTVTGSLDELESKAATLGSKEDYQKRVGKINY